MPTTSPRALNSGPPELPGFTATSVWMKGTALSSGSERPLALTTPAVTVFSKPKGAPMASTHSPTRRLSVLPSVTTGRLAALIFSTAMSVLGSVPSTLALNSRRSVSLTTTSVASFTTCALVRMTPSAPTMKPEPMRRACAAALRLPPRWNWRKNSSGSPLNCAPFSAEALPVTLMLTTAGP
jgi:hypothetical protein